MHFVRRERRTVAHLLAAAFLTLGFASTLHAAGAFIPGTGEGTGEKPQSKLWYNDATWWAVIKREGRGLHFYEFDGASWLPCSFLDAELGTGGVADVKWNGEELFVLSYSSRPKLFKYRYNRALRVFDLVSGFPVSIPIAGGSETMVLDQDSNGRLWAAYEGATGTIFVTWTTSADHTTWASSGLVLRDGVSEDDIASVVAFDGKIGVFWSDQNRDQFGFRVHRDGDAPEDWDSVEVVASGSGLADDHINVKVAGNGDVYAVTKDDHDDMRLHVRRASTGKWTTKTGVISGSGTRGILQLCDADKRIYAAYTTWSSSVNHAVLRKATYATLSFSTDDGSFITGATMNNCTGTKQVLPSGCLMVLCEGGGHTWWNGWGTLPPDGPQPPPPPGDVETAIQMQAVPSGDAPALVLDLRLDEGAGTTAHDESPAQHTAQLVQPSGKSALPAWTAGRRGNALAFDTQNGYAEVPSSDALRIAGSFTVEAWVRWDGDTTPGTLLSKGNSNKRNYQVVVRTDGRIDFKWEISGGSNRGVIGARSLQLGTWHHVACVYDQASGRSRIYLDGRLDASKSESGTPAVSTDPLLLGVRLSSSSPIEYLHGAVDDVRIWAGVRYDADFDPEARPESAQMPDVASAGVRIQWSSPDPERELTFHVYRSVNGGGRTRLTGASTSALAFVDTNPILGRICYEVTALDSLLREGRPSAASCVFYASPTQPQPGNRAAARVDAERTALDAFPNPFNPQTTLRLRMPEAGWARVAIFDVAGRRVALVHAGELAAGDHRFDWRPDPRLHAHSGVYFVRAEAAGRVQSYKLLLVK